MTDGRPPRTLSAAQARILEAWLPGHAVVRDLSWGLVGTTVLEVVAGGELFVVKAGDERDGHIARELRAHREWLEPWVRRGRGPTLVHGCEAEKLVVTRHLPGELVQGGAAECDPDTYRQAGVLLALLHGQLEIHDTDHERALNERAGAWLDGPHRIAPDVEARLRAEIASWPTPPSTLVPTHGDWQPRNWLVHEGTVSVIDLGRADLRPAHTDLARLAAQQFRTDPALERAFWEGYGVDPREPGAWHRTLVREAIGTAAWAFQVGDEAFEAQGHRMIADALGTPAERE